MKSDFSAPTESQKIRKALSDGVGGMILAVAEMAGIQEQVFCALTTNGRFPGVYNQKDCKADIRVRRP